MWITYQILLHAGKDNQKVNHWILKSEFFAKLKYQILEMDGSRLQPLAVDLLFEICRVQSLKPHDLGKPYLYRTHWINGNTQMGIF
jgi:hypothetical protein